MKDISIIIPVYNGEKYIEECLDSILEQKYSNIEVIIVDDGSVDNSYDICKRYSDSYPFIKVIHQSNMGVSKARNTALIESKGKYIYFLDSDDKLNNNFFSTVLDNIENYDLLTFNWYTWYINDKFKSGIDKEYILDKKSAMEMCTKVKDSFQGYLWNKLFLGKIIRDNNLKFNEEISVCEDLLFVLKYLTYCDKIHCIDDILYNYRMRKGSVSKKFNLNKFKSTFDAYDHILKILDEEQIENSINIKFEYLFIYYLYKKIFTKNGVFLRDSVKKFYKEVLKSKNISFKRKKDLFMVKNMIYVYKINNRIVSKFRKNYVMFE